MEFTASVIESTSSKHGEGALWDVRTNRLLWVDIDGCRVNRFDPKTGKNESVEVASAVGTVVRRKQGNDEVIAAIKTGCAAVDMGTGKATMLTPMDLGGVRFNDGKCDPAGRFWVGTMAPRGTAVLYRVDADLSVRPMVPGVSTSNGIVWSKDCRTMYYIDTPTGMVEAFDYDNASGAIANRRCAVKVAAELGHPDGMTIDDQDRLWVAMWGGARVCCFDPKTAALLHTVHTPGARHSSACALGGEGMAELFITTSTQGIKPEDRAGQPNAGKLFRCNVPAKGLAAYEFAG